MKGLLQSNYYASCAGAKWLFGMMLIWGIAAACGKSSGILILFGLAAMIIFPVNALMGMRKEDFCKWAKLRLTAPVRRRDIVGGQYLTFLGWMLLGAVLAAVFVGLSVLLHGVIFDRNRDILMLFSLGFCANLFLCALYFPVSYKAGNEKGDAVLIISILCTAGILTGLILFVNWLLGPSQKLVQVLVSVAIMAALAVTALFLSYPIACRIFERKEY